MLGDFPLCWSDKPSQGLVSRPSRRVRRPPLPMQFTMKSTTEALGLKKGLIQIKTLPPRPALILTRGIPVFVDLIPHYETAFGLHDPLPLCASPAFLCRTSCRQCGAKAEARDSHRGTPHSPISGCLSQLKGIPGKGA